MVKMPGPALPPTHSHKAVSNARKSPGPGGPQPVQGYMLTPTEWAGPGEEAAGKQGKQRGGHVGPLGQCAVGVWCNALPPSPRGYLLCPCEPGSGRSGGSSQNQGHPEERRAPKPLFETLEVCRLSSQMPYLKGRVEAKPHLGPQAPGRMPGHGRATPASLHLHWGGCNPGSDTPPGPEPPPGRTLT